MWVKTYKLSVKFFYRTTTAAEKKTNKNKQKQTKKRNNDNNNNKKKPDSLHKPPETNSLKILLGCFKNAVFASNTYSLPNKNK